MRRSLVDTRRPSPLRRLCRCVSVCVCFFFFFHCQVSPGLLCGRDLHLPSMESMWLHAPPHTHTHTHTHLMLQWRCLYCRNARRCCVFVHVCVCLSREWSKTHREYPPPLLTPPPSWPSPCEVGWAEIRRVIKTHSLGGWSERAGHVSLMFAGEIHDVSGSKEKRTSACVCVCVCVCVSGLFNWTLAGQSSFLSAFVRERLCDHSRRRVHCEREAVPGNVHLNQGERSHKYRVHRGDEDSAPCRTKSAHK